MSSKIILGIDPGLGTTGWGVIHVNGNAMSYLAGGAIKTDAKAPISARLQQLFDGLQEVVANYKPTAAAVEEVFVNVNAKSSLKLGQARGIALLVPALHGLPVEEYTPLNVKKALVGYGKAEKSQVQMMVKTLLPTADFATHDTADALAVAICHANTSRTTAMYR